MATRSFIAMKTRPGYKAIYCHWDGYPDYVGKYLKRYYDYYEKVKELIGLGDISKLDKELGKKHSFSHPTPGWVVAYHRDRGEAWSEVKPKKTETLRDLKELAKQYGAEYLYVFQKGKWRTVDLW